MEFKKKMSLKIFLGVINANAVFNLNNYLRTVAANRNFYVNIITISESNLDNCMYLRNLPYCIQSKALHLRIWMVQRASFSTRHATIWQMKEKRIWNWIRGSNPHWRLSQSQRISLHARCYNTWQFSRSYVNGQYSIRWNV